MNKNQEGKERRSEEEARANKRKYVKRGGQRSKRNKGEEDTQGGQQGGTSDGSLERRHGNVR